MRNGERITIEHNECQNNEVLSPRARRLKLIEQIRNEHDLQMSLQNIHNEVFEAELAKYRAAGIRLCFSYYDCVCIHLLLQHYAKSTRSVIRIVTRTQMIVLTVSQCHVKCKSNSTWIRTKTRIKSYIVDIPPIWTIHL